MTPLRQVVAKGKNVRIIIELHEKENTKGFIVHTKRLQDFNKRLISTSTVSYSLETFLALIELSNQFFLGDSLITNKILLKEINKIKSESKFKVSSWTKDVK